MSVSGLHHFTIQCTLDDLPLLVDFYRDILHLTPGDRPAMGAPGFWMYCHGHPLVHLYAGLKERPKGSTGALDHISFRGHALEETRTFLRSKAIRFDELPVDGWPLHQIFLQDPTGLKLELTFDLNEETGKANDHPV